MEISSAPRWNARTRSTASPSAGPSTITGTLRFHVLPGLALAKARAELGLGARTRSGRVALRESERLASERGVEDVKAVDLS